MSVIPQCRCGSLTYPNLAAARDALRGINKRRKQTHSKRRFESRTQECPDNRGRYHLTSTRALPTRQKRREESW